VNKVTFVGFRVAIAQIAFLELSLVTKDRKGKVVESAHKVFYQEVDFAPTTHLQSLFK